MLKDPISDVRFAQLVDLVEMGIAEGTDLEYKVDLPDLKPDSGKREFLRDVCAMANGGGGWIIYGVSGSDGDTDDRAVPGSIVGVTCVDFDQAKIRILDIVRSGISPRPDIQVEDRIDDSGDKSVLIVRIHEASRPPCMVSYNNEMCCWMRKGARKYRMDIDEVRRTIVESETWLERLRDFRAARLNAFRLDHTVTTVPIVPVYPVNLVPLQSRLIMHVAPARFFRQAVGAYELAKVVRGHKPKLMGDLHPTMRPNFDGFLAYDGGTDGGAIGYVQVFRSGVVETVDCLMFKGEGHESPEDTHIFAADFRLRLSAVVQDQLALLGELSYAPPYAVMVSLVNVAGWVFAHSNLRAGEFEHDMLFPELLLDDEEDLINTIDELMLMVWQAAGHDEPPR